MVTAFREALVPDEIRSLVIFDHKAFVDYKADWFEGSDWSRCQPWWLIVNGIKVGCCAFELNRDFDETPATTRPRSGSLYIASTGILPRFRGSGFGDLMKRWQISYARYHGFKRKRHPPRHDSENR